RSCASSSARRIAPTTTPTPRSPTASPPVRCPSPSSARWRAAEGLDGTTLPCHGGPDASEPWPVGRPRPRRPRASAAMVATTDAGRARPGPTDRLDQADRRDVMATPRRGPEATDLTPDHLEQRQRADGTFVEPDALADVV